MDYFLIIIIIVFILSCLSLYAANRYEKKEKNQSKNRTAFETLNPQDYLLEEKIVSSAPSVLNTSPTTVTTFFAGILDLIAFLNFISSFFYGLFLLSSTTSEFGKTFPDHNPITVYLGITFIIQGIIVSTLMVLFAEIAKNIDQIRRVIENRAEKGKM